jgi:IclR family acetate operon transcriptional repressor
MQGETIKVLDRALDILQILSLGADGLSLAELSNALQLPTATVRRLLQNMVKSGFVEYDAAVDRYKLGLILLGLSATLRQDSSLASTSQPVLDWLRDQTNETASVRVRFQYSAIVVATSETNLALRHVRPLGQGLPLHAGAASKLLLAHLPPDELEDFFSSDDFTPLTDNTIVNKDDLREELERIRRQNYSISFAEVSRDAAALSVPVFDFSNRVVAAIGIVAPTARMTVSKLMDQLDVVTEAGRLLSRQLGFDEGNRLGSGAQASLQSADGQSL